MKRRIMGILALALMFSGVFSLLSPRSAMALGGESCGAPDFMGFKPWYAGLCLNGEVDFPEKGKDEDGSELKSFIWIVVLNVLFDLTLAVGYLAVGFVIYGGYLYIMSQGDPARAIKGKKTLAAAVIGTVISLMASVIVNTGRVILGINSISGWKNNRNFGALQVQNIFTWAYTVAGMVAVAFIIRGAVDYLVSQGDPGKVRKATMSIIYAVVGLVIVLLASVITMFVVKSVGSNL